MNAGTHIVVGLDGSDTSLGAAKWAVAVAEKLGQPLHLVHSAPSPAHASDDDLSQQLIDSLAAEGARCSPLRSPPSANARPTVA